MTRKAEDFVAHCFLETIYKGQCYDHHCNTDDGGANGKPDNKAGKRVLPIKSYSICYKACNVQGMKFVFKNNSRKRFILFFILNSR